MCGRKAPSFEISFDRYRLAPATLARRRLLPRRAPQPGTANPAAHRTAIAAAALLALCGPASGEPAASGSLFDRTQALAFDHRCSEPARNDNAYREALALFEAAPTHGYRGIALGSVLVGWVGGFDGARGVAVSLERLRLSLPRPWHDAPLGLHVALTDPRSGRTATGAPSTRYARRAPTGLVDVELRTSPEGEVDWA